MEARLHASLHTKGLTGVSHLTLAYIEGVDGRTYGDVMTKFSRIDGLPYFLINGAPRARSSAIINNQEGTETLYKSL